MKNLVIFVADSLRYDYIPKTIAKKGSLIKTLSPSLYTSTSFASLLTARSPENHNVRTFFDSLDPRIKTVFDVFEHGSYYDHPNDPMSKIVLKNCPSPIELKEMEEPFVWVERAMDTHIPYGRMRHGNEISRKNGVVGKEYIHALLSGKIDRVKEYIKGVRGVEEHFWSHIDELKSMGVYERTLVIFTADHGELLGEYCTADVHNYPPCRELVEVPTVFLNMKLGIDLMRSIDILPTALSILGKKRLFGKCDGVDVRKEKPKKGVNLTIRTLTIWELKNGGMNLAKYYRKRQNWARNKWIPIPLSILMLARKLNPIMKKEALLL